MRASDFTPREDLARSVELAGARLADARDAATIAAEWPSGEVDNLAFDEQAAAPIPERWRAGALGVEDVYGIAVSAAENARGGLAALVNASALEVVMRSGEAAMHRWTGAFEALGLSPDARILGVSAPQPHFVPGSRVSAPGPALGTLGALIATDKGQDGVLTAGHVAVRGSAVSDASGNAGTVAFSIDPAQVPALATTADVAVIVPGPGGALPSPIVSLGATARAAGAAPVTMYGAVSGQRQGTIMGFSPFLYVPKMSGQWESVYFTTAAISAPGDSGAPVVLDGTGDLIGHVVGGSGAATTYIQSVDVQLNASRCAFRPGP